MGDVLVDSSAWIDFFRGDRVARARLDPLLASRRAAVCGPVYAEVVSGARERGAFDRLARLLRLVDWIEPPESAWQEVAEARFALARQGFQASLLDLLIAVTALRGGHSLLTRDRDFTLIGRALSVEVDVF